MGSHQKIAIRAPAQCVVSGPPESTSQTASRSVHPQPFQHSEQTDTRRPRLTGNNTPHLDTLWRDNQLTHGSRVRRIRLRSHQRRRSGGLVHEHSALSWHT